MNNPIQPTLLDQHEILRFKKNAIVAHLLDYANAHGYGMNELALNDFTDDDRQQFAQLIGYSLHGYAELSYVDNYNYNTVLTMVNNEAINQYQARISYLENELINIKTMLREPVAEIFGINADDLEVL